jgi:FixJ family two-component response regulator
MAATCARRTAFMTQDPRVYVVDDDASVLSGLEKLLRANGFHVEVFRSAAVFLQRPPTNEIACLILDLRMPTLNGLDVQEILMRQGVPLPVVFLSGYGDVPTSVEAMRRGAVDFLVKPVDEQQLIEAIGRALERAKQLHERRQLEHDVTSRLARLTKREREVCDLVVRGLLNKQIGFELGMSEKTVKVHRGRVMNKLQVDSVAALVRLMALGGRNL